MTAATTKACKAKVREAAGPLLTRNLLADARQRRLRPAREPGVIEPHSPEWPIIAFFRRRSPLDLIDGNGLNVPLVPFHAKDSIMGDVENGEAGGEIHPPQKRAIL